MASFFSNYLTTVLVIFCSVSIIATTAVLTGDDLLVTAGELGKIRGVARTTTLSKRDYVEFQGIPYAKPPTGETRFLPPEPITPPLAAAGEAFNATKPMPCCPQLATSVLSLCYGTKQNENCLGLILNTPQIEGKHEKLFPVIVFIHGGAFSIGSADMYTGSRLLERDLVIVSVNYRLGLLGFFNLNTESVAGNAAMYDLLEALDWVKTYVKYFGGDPDSITIVGQSAGSVAVSHLVLSPLARDKGLFHKAISMSGTALNEWGTTTAETSKIECLKIAQRLGCNDPGKAEDPDTIARCMRGKSTTELIQTLETYQREERRQGRLGFSSVTPIIQAIGPSGGPRFMDEMPETILEQSKQAKIPLMMGTTRHDGSFVLSFEFNQFLRVDGIDLHLNATFLRTRLVPTLLQALGIQDKTEAVYETLANVYLGEEIKRSGNFSLMIPGLTDLHSVFFYKAAAYRTLKMHSSVHKDSYWYSFDYKGRHSLYETLVNTTGNPIPGGVTHGDDLIYAFSIPSMNLNPEEQAVSDRLINYWANFAYSGNPNSQNNTNVTTGEEWLSFSEDFPHYVSMGTQNEVVNNFPTDSWLGMSVELLPELFPPSTTPQPSTSREDQTTENLITESTTDGSERFSTSAFLLTILVASAMLL